MTVAQFESYRRGLAASTAFNLLSQGIGFVTLLLFANYFGAQDKTDIYLFCAATVTSVAALITCLNASVVIPETMRLRVQESPARSARFFNCFLFGYSVAAMSILAALWLNPVGLVSAVSSFDAATLQAHRPLLVLAGPMLLGEVIVVSLNDLLVSHRFFTMPSLSTMLNRLIQIVALSCLHSKIDIYAMPAGILAAYALQVIALLVILRRRLDWSPTLEWRAILPRVVRNSGFSLAGNLVSTLAQLVPLYLLSGFAAGVLSAMNYATRVVNVPENFLTRHVSAVTAIRLNHAQAEGDLASLDLTFSRACRGLAFLLTPLSLVLFVLAEPVVRILFERGSFDAEAAREAAFFLQWLGLTLPFLGVNSVVARLFMAAQKIVPAFWYQLVQNLLFIGMQVGAVRWFGAAGYAYAAVAFRIWNVVALLPVINRCFPHVHYRRVLAHLALIVLLNVGLGALLTPIASLLEPTGPWASVLVVGTLFGAVILILQRRYVLSPEVNDMLASVLPARLFSPRNRQHEKPRP